MSTSNTGSFQPSIQPKDAIWSAGLLFMLVLVFAADRGRTPKEDQAANPPKKVTKIDLNKTPSHESSNTISRPLRLGVTVANPLYDDMGKLLNTLGDGYRFKTINLNEVLDTKILDDLDVLFMTCSPAPDAWIQQVTNFDGARPGTANSQAKPEVIERLRDNLRAFVGRGGTLYASDWQFNLIAFAFPEFIEPGRAVDGKSQTVTATAGEEGLRKAVGDRLQLNFDLPGWKPAAFIESKVSVLLHGDYLSMEDQKFHCPFLIKFGFEKGSVIFTSFHNEKQNSELETKLLRYLVFTTILAKTEAQMTATLIQGGFKQTGKSLLSVSRGSPSQSDTYQCEKSGPLQFSLGFENGQAKMKLSVVGPDNVAHEAEGASPLVIDIPNGIVGQWKYTIVMIDAPYDNFPYALTIGQK